eukprot:SAG31_NODE_4182_length_3495_cov_1.750294_4_plen_304_part_00
MLFGRTSPNLNENGSRMLAWPLGPDGRSGEQPRGTLVEGNVAREIALWQKQSAFLFQAVAAQTKILRNTAFNMPRAALNFNDGHGGGDEVAGNLLLNTCRESGEFAVLCEKVTQLASCLHSFDYFCLGDHGCVPSLTSTICYYFESLPFVDLDSTVTERHTIGLVACSPFNSWDRVPYITTIRSGKPSVIPADRHIHHNLILANYNTVSAIDTDDGSAYYNVTANVFAYGSTALKSGCECDTFSTCVCLFVQSNTLLTRMHSLQTAVTTITGLATCSHSLPPVVCRGCRGFRDTTIILRAILA